MSANNKNKKIKAVKKWFLIQKVKFGMFAKEHKYITAIMGVFIMSSVIALIVFASDEDIYAQKVKAERNGNIKISSTSDPETENTREVKSFSTIVYDIPFKLILTDGDTEAVSTRIVDVTATLDSSIDAEITTLDDNVKITSKTENGKQEVILNDYAGLYNSQSISVYLNVYNIKDGTTISPDITVCDKANKNEDRCFTLSGEDTKVTVRSKEINLVPKTIPGLPYDYSVGTEQKMRYFPFGILVGIRESDINEDGTLTGLYINPDINLSLSAISSVTSMNTEEMDNMQLEYIEQVNVEDFYGLYAGKTRINSRSEFFTSKAFPYHSILATNNASIPAVYHSGEIEYRKCESTDLNCNLFGEEYDNVYSLNITGVKTDGRYVVYNGGGIYDLLNDYVKFLEIFFGALGNIFGSPVTGANDYLALGSYYVTAAAKPLDLEKDYSRAFRLNVKYKDSDKIGDGISFSGYDNTTINHTTKTTLTFLNENEEELNDSYGVAYGEEVILKAESNYEYINIDDEDTHNYDLIGKIPVAAMEYNEELEPFEMIEYNSNIDEFPYFVNINGTKENLDEHDVKVTYVACVDLQQCSLENEEEDLTYSSYEDYKNAKQNAILNNSKLYLSYVKYEISNLPNKATVDFRLKLKVGTNGFGQVNAELFNEFFYNEFGEQQSILKKSSDKIKVTPYKARISLNIDRKGDDVLVNLSDKTSSTIAIYPKVNMPANMINTNTVPLKKIDRLIVEVYLPEKINYVENDNYLKPALIERDGKKLTYVLYDEDINSWIEPIYLDVNYSIDVSSNVEYKIKTQIEATSTREDNGKKIYDASDSADKTTYANIKFINTGILSSSMTTYNTTILRNSDFDVTTKIYNRSNQEQNNLELITILPYNDQSNSSFNGSYKLDITNINSVECTTDSFINLFEESNVLWEDCSLYSDKNYEGVTAIKTNNINLNPNQIFEQTFNIIPLDNSSSDYYKIESYIKTNDNKKKNIIPITVYVEATKITGTVWEDFNGDGLISSDESKIIDVELNLYDSENGKLIQTVFSDKNGNYTFDQISKEKHLDSSIFYITANYNTTKYSLTSYNIGNDKSINSSFCSMKGNTCLSNVEDNYDYEIEEEQTEFITRTENFSFNNNKYIIGNINLGLTPKKLFSIKLNKFITNTTVTNPFGFMDNKSFANVSFAKLNVKDISNVSIKVTYTIEIQNNGYYPGYVYSIKDIVPDGMKFNSAYQENAGWELNELGYLENRTLANSVIKAGEKKYVNLSLDLVRKEAGSFVNYVFVEDSDLEIYNGTASELKNGGTLNE